MAYPTQDSRNISVLMLVLSIFFWFIPALVMFLIKKDDDFVYNNSVALLNFEITLTIAYFALAFIPILGWLAMMGIGIAALVLLVMSAIKVQNGEPVTFPFTLQLVKA
ncbi:MAG: DUF4870 domain-containing protein [Methylophilaceae bacterium]|jgi:uncharacterized Tic20 family protein